MKKIFICAAFAAVAMIACEKKDVELSGKPEEMVNLEIMIPEEATKVSGAGGNEEKTVVDYQVLIYDATNNMLEAYLLHKDVASTIEMQCTTGPKEIVVMANAPDLSKVVSFNALKQTRSRLSDNAVKKLVMEGHVSQTLKSGSNTVEVALERIVSKVVLSSIKVDFELPVYDAMSFVVKSAYLINAPADKSYLSKTADPTEWYNKLKRESNNSVDAMLYEAVNSTITSPNTDSNAHHFYCYPNPNKSDTFSTDWSPRPTRLVVEAELGGTLYYYPVSLPELKQNTQCNVSLTVVRPGATSPEQDMDKYAAVFNIEIKDWYGPDTVTETI